MSPLRVGIVGMGPAGLNAAFEFCRSYEKPFELFFFEKKEKPAKKLLATGNGRCNLAHEGDILPHYHGSLCEKVLPQVFAHYGFSQTKALHEDMGILYTTDERGRIYPHSLSAKAVVDLYEKRLMELCKKKTIHLLYNTIIKDIRSNEDGTYCVRAVGEGKGEYELDAVVLACGGEASPAFGSDGDGKYLLQKMGVSFTQTRPALCRLLTKQMIPQELQGLKWDVSLTTSGQVFEGELLFTKEGLSGPVALESSFYVGEALEKDKAQVEINFCPEYSQEELTCILEGVLHNNHSAEALMGFLPLPLIRFLYRAEDSVAALAQRLQHCVFEISSLSGFSDAQVTVGGVEVQELNCDLSLIQYPHVYVCGELCDCVGDCGGYNLQWAFSSGLCVGQALAKTF